jgi:hypothetical protein
VEGVIYKKFYCTTSCKVVYFLGVVMGKLDTFQAFLAGKTVHISLSDFVVNFVVAAIFSLLLKHVYVKYGKSVSNKKAFSDIFPVLTLSTLLIITIVKSSLALSLGLVGALSIVRFRTAIKEPEELAYLFLCICIGLGFGASQGLVTGIGLFGILITIYGRSLFSSRKTLTKEETLYLTLSHSQDIKPKNILELVSKHCDFAKLKRWDEVDSNIEYLFLVSLSEIKNLEELREELLIVDSKLKISFVDPAGAW